MGRPGGACSAVTRGVTPSPLTQCHGASRKSGRGASSDPTSSRARATSTGTTASQHSCSIARSDGVPDALSAAGIRAGTRRAGRAARCGEPRGAEGSRGALPGTYRNRLGGRARRGRGGGRSGIATAGARPAAEPVDRGRSGRHVAGEGCQVGGAGAHRRRGGGAPRGPHGPPAGPGRAPAGRRGGARVCGGGRRRRGAGPRRGCARTRPAGTRCARGGRPRRSHGRSARPPVRLRRAASPPVGRRRGSGGALVHAAPARRVPPPGVGVGAAHVTRGPHDSNRGPNVRGGPNASHRSLLRPLSCASCAGRSDTPRRPCRHSLSLRFHAVPERPRSRKRFISQRPSPVPTL